MKTKLVLLFFISLLSLSASAQYHTLSDAQQVELKKQEIRQKLNIDYSMPDFDTKKVDGKVIGIRLAKMLEFLQKNYTLGLYNLQLSDIRFDYTQDSNVHYLGIDKMKINRIKKVGEVISVHFSTISKNDKKKKLQHEFDIVFDKGVSNNDRVNSLFTDISRYIKEIEE